MQEQGICRDIIKNLTLICFYFYIITIKTASSYGANVLAGQPVCRNYKQKVNKSSVGATYKFVYAKNILSFFQQTLYIPIVFEYLYFCNYMLISI